ncbi:hemopexin-like isoform X2 [Narcine bancroftii]|uniref:hemopexin-like isoform X2 n=1 Tax=Narcine bancroftii TaxID=1343680 RepID=UPI0038315719
MSGCVYIAWRYIFSPSTNSAQTEPRDTMKSLLWELCLCSVLAFTSSHPWLKGRKNITLDMTTPPEPRIPGFPDRCDGLGFNAITLDNDGVSYFFRDEFVWKGFKAEARLINATWPRLPSHLQAAFRLHQPSAPELHDKIFFFKGDMVWQYNNMVPEGSFPIREKFPGIPDNLTGAVECPIGDCYANSVIFSKGNAIFVLDLTTNKMKEKLWPRVRGCTALMKWIDKYYCFRGTYFLRFNPITGHVAPQYPKDSRDYFMRCKGRGHWSKNSTVDRNIFNSCSNLSYDEFTQDQLGRIYAFRGNWYFRPDLKRDGRHPWSLNSSWPSLHGKVDGVFNWDHKMYFIKGPQLFIYKAEGSYSLIDGYPKPVEEELGITDSHIDATFVCPHTSLLYVIQEHFCCAFHPRISLPNLL